MNEPSPPVEERCECGHGLADHRSFPTTAAEPRAGWCTKCIHQPDQHLHPYRPSPPAQVVPDVEAKAQAWAHEYGVPWGFHRNHYAINGYGAGYEQGRADERAAADGFTHDEALAFLKRAGAAEASLESLRGLAAAAEAVIVSGGSVQYQANLNRWRRLKAAPAVIADGIEAES